MLVQASQNSIAAMTGREALDALLEKHQVGTYPTALGREWCERRKVSPDEIGEDIRGILENIQIAILRGAETVDQAFAD